MAGPTPIPNAKSFPKGKSGNPKGRPRKGVAATLSALKEAGHEEVTAEQVRATMGRMLNLPREELVKMGNDAKAPIMDALIARALAGKDGWQALSDILDRAHGKAKQAVEMSGDIGMTTIVRRELKSKADLKEKDA
jgi:hypothetical protein